MKNVNITCKDFTIEGAALHDKRLRAKGPVNPKPFEPAANPTNTSHLKPPNTPVHDASANRNFDHDSTDKTNRINANFLS